VFAAVLTLASSPVVSAQGTGASAPTTLTPCLSRAESKQFDFWVGEWEVEDARGTHVGRSSVQKILAGCVVFENWTADNGVQGKSLNAYNAGLGMWQQFWTSQTGNVTEYRTSEWVDGSLRFVADMAGAQPPRTLRLTFTPVDGNTVRQHGEVSKDGGATYTTTYDYYYHRAK
jgi:hypothetical protein